MPRDTGGVSAGGVKVMGSENDRRILKAKDEKSYARPGGTSQARRVPLHSDIAPCSARSAQNIAGIHIITSRHHETSDIKSDLS